MTDRPAPTTAAASPLPPGAPRPRAVLILTEQLVHRATDGQGGAPFSLTPPGRQVALATSEQPWQRHFTARPVWAPLECGWLDGGAGLLHLENRGPQTKRTVVPTPEEAAADAACVVELAVLPPTPPPDPRRTMHDPPLPPPAEPVLVAVLTPGGVPARLPNPGDPTRYRVRTRAGEARCVLTLFPL